MPFISITRLRVRSARFLPAFALHTLRSIRQARGAAGFHGGALLVDRGRTFWTLTTWDAQDSMRGYMSAGAHRLAMPHLLDWCDEASVAHWTQPEDTLPSWGEVDRRMRESGRPSKVRHPSPQHAIMSFSRPRPLSAASIKPTPAVEVH